MPKTDPRVDAYIKHAAPFAQPILAYLRSVVHEACPDVDEGMKWSFPHFDYKGIFCSMAAFKQHAAFGFWKGELLASQLPKVDERAMGHFGRLTSVKDLPSRATLIRIIRAAAKLNDDGVKVQRMAGARKPPVRPPDDLRKALGNNAKAMATFAAFRPSQKREYVEWITEAKQAATRDRRLATAVAWMAEGKERNWKYTK